VSREIEHDPTACDVCARLDPGVRALDYPDGWRRWIAAHVAAGRPLRIDVTAAGARALEISSLGEVTPIARQRETRGGREMRLDGVEHRHHVRERGNLVAVVLTQPGWAAHTGHDYWYLSVEDKVDGLWRHRRSADRGMRHGEALSLALRWYDEEASGATP